MSLVVIYQLLGTIFEMLLSFSVCYILSASVELFQHIPYAFTSNVDDILD